MGSLKDIANQPKLQTFPNAQFMIEGEVPASQCSEARIQGDNAITIVGQILFDSSAPFAGWNLVGKTCTITASAGGNPGDYNIVANSGTTLDLQPDPGIGNPVAYYVHNGGALILTRDIKSFAEFIHAAGYAYTIKGGTLYTNIPSSSLQPACSILFDPLT